MRPLSCRDSNKSYGRLAGVTTAIVYRPSRVWFMKIRREQHKPGKHTCILSFPAVIDGLK